LRNHTKIVDRLLAWFSGAARDLPWRRTPDPYAIWVSEIMLQQTQVKTVLPYWKRWMRALPNLEALANANSQRLHKLWEGLGYYTRVRNMQKAARLVMARHEGKFPTDFHDVLALPGIGRYTAGAICSIAFGQPKPILDGNVIRVLTRLFGISGNPREKATNARLWHLAEQLVQRAAQASRFTVHVSRFSSLVSRSCSQLNQSLMELGALICTPKAPQCGACPVARQCIAFRHGRVTEFPHQAKRLPASARRYVAVVAERRGRFLVRQRPAGVVNAHLWEFPNLEIGQDGTDLRTAAKTLLGFNPSSPEHLCTIKHSITRYRITLDVYRVREGWKRGTERNGKWIKPSELSRLPFASAHKRILRLLGRRQRHGRQENSVPTAPATV
jgi:A/G-specific adenine glycosylase